jgi:hypothetical protein
MGRISEYLDFERFPRQGPLDEGLAKAGHQASPHCPTVWPSSYQYERGGVNALLEEEERLWWSIKIQSSQSFKSKEHFLLHAGRYAGGHALLSAASPTWGSKP